MIKITNSQNKIVEIQSETDRNISTMLKYSQDTRRFIDAVVNLQTEQSNSSTHLLKATKNPAIKKLMNGVELSNEAITDMSDDELAIIKQLGSIANQTYKSKIDLVDECLKLLGLTDVNDLTFADVNTIYNLVTTDPANSFR